MSCVYNFSSEDGTVDINIDPTKNLSAGVEFG
jgi:hypothetical protein